VSFQVLDMAVLQDIYGTSSDSSHSVDNQYAFTPDAPSASAEVQQFRTFAGQFKLIWDSGGIDTFDASAYTASKRVRLDLREGAQSSIEEDAQSSPDGKLNVSVAFNSEIEKAVGGAGNDTLIGNQLANELRGGAGADRLDGGTARFADNGGLAIGVGDGQIDTLIGCEGPDVYVIRQGVARDVVDDSGANDMLEFRDQGGLQLIGQLVGVRVAAGTDV
jgi:serralysin